MIRARRGVVPQGSTQRTVGRWMPGVLRPAGDVDSSVVQAVGVWLERPLGGRLRLDATGRRLQVTAGLREPGPRPLTREGLVRFPADRIHKGVVEALVPGALSVPGPGDSDRELERWWRSYHVSTGSKRDRLEGKLGFRLPPDPEAWELLRRNPALAIKAHYALWARCFAETDAARPAGITLSRFLDDLGCARLANGAHRPAAKRQAQVLVRLLSAMELDLEYQAPNGRSTRLSGTLWELETDGRSLAVLPGDWFEDPVWARFNRRVGLAAAGLLGLRPDRDQWPMCVGGYLAPLARMNGYRPLTLRVRILLERSGLARAESRNPARMREKLERSLERLEEVGVLGQWDWSGGAGTEPDMDSGAELLGLSGAASGWLERSIEIRWPAELDVHSKRLQDLRSRGRVVRSSRSGG